MRIKYYETAWRDISNSPGWFGKLCLLALVNFIPIFGQMVTLGYLYGWAREIAWGANAPMPAKLICNEDGKFWRRGWFVFVVTFAFALIPSVVMNVGNALQNTGLWALSSSGARMAEPMMAMVGLLLYLVGLVGTLLMGVLAWIGAMRTSIYDRLSAGFQFGKIWKMFRRDTGGIMRIFGMNLLVGLIIGVILSIVITILFTIVLVVGVAGVVGAGYNVDSLDYMSRAEAARMLMQFLASAGAVGIIALIATLFVSFMGSVFIDMLVIRALGYWVNQFDVPRWRGQNDPMPFETVGTYSGQSAQSPMYYANGADFGMAPNMGGADVTAAAPGASMFDDAAATPDASMFDDAAATPDASMFDEMAAAPGANAMDAAGPEGIPPAAPAVPPEDETL